MKITDSTLVLQSSHHSEVKDVARESLRIWQGGSEATESEVLGAGAGRLRQRASALLQNPPVRPAESPVNSIELTPVQAVADGEASLDPLQDLEVSLLKLLVERFTGHEIRVTTPADLRSETTESVAAETPQVVQNNEESRGAGWGMVYNNYQSHYESEQTDFQAQGIVKTADGREIAIDIQLNMSREFFSESSMTLRAGDALKDPLVVNFSGSAAELTRERFDFDIDADGVSDQIHFVTPDSGFLALDRNQDGIINNGSELFGTRSGNGFADLASFDSDENGWIDENDAVFDRLRIWSKDAEGRDQLVALGAKGVGAVYLGHITTPFEMKDDDNQLLGVVRESGLYLDEDGIAGTMQQIDLVV